jgi:hypothetical protein
MGEARSAHGKEESCTKRSGKKNVNGRFAFEDMNVDVNVLLKALKKRNGKM